MKRHAPRITTATALLMVTSCGGGPGVSTQPLQPMIAVGAQADGAMTVGDLRRELLAFADRAMGEIVSASGTALAADSAPTTRAYVRSLQANIAATSVALAVEPDPEQALLDLMVSIAVLSGSVGEAAPETIHPDARSTLESSLAFLEGSIWDVGELVYPAAELTGLRTRLDLWRKAAGEKRPYGVVRVADLPADAGPNMSKGLFAPPQ